jgi:hypothetical protein
MGKRLSVFENPRSWRTRILPIMDSEGAVETDFVRILTKQLSTDGVKGAGPGKRIADRLSPGLQHLLCDALHAPLHFGGGPARGSDERAAMIAR